MVYLRKSNQARTTQSQHKQRLASVAHLYRASKDINYWRFEMGVKPHWSPPSCDHVFRAIDTKTGIVQEWMIDINQADEHGQFDAEHRRIIDHFTQSLVWLQELMRENQSRMALKSKGIVLPSGSFNFEAAAKAALHRGDHDNDYVS